MSNNLNDYNDRLFDGLTINRDARKRAAVARDRARADHIRTLRDAELEAYCTPAELVNYRGIRNHYAAMNLPELTFQATFDQDAARELEVRNGTRER